MPEATQSANPKEPVTEPEQTSQASGPAAPAAPAGPVTVQVGPQGHVTVTVQPSAAVLMPDLALETVTPKGLADFFGGARPEGEPQSSPFQQVLDQLRQALNALGDKIVRFTEDVTALEVRTFVSDRIEDVRMDGARGFTFAQQRAMTYIAFDGDTQVVVPVDAGQIDEALWRIHLQTVEAAQAHREAMLKTVGELVSGFIPTLK